jgi:PKD repeat protein
MNIGHDFTSSGSFEVVLTVQDNDGAIGQSANSVNVEEANASPVAAFLIECDQGNCSFDATASYDSDGTISSYTWDFGDGSNTETQNALSSHEYGAAGDYLVKLTVSDDLAATGNAESWVSVAIDPPVNVDPSADFTFECQELSCTFNASNSIDPDGFISNYSWSFGDGNGGDGEIMTHVFSAEGIYDVTLNVTDNGEASNFVTKQVQVERPVSNTFQLTVTGQKSRGRKSAQLIWSGALSPQVDIFRDGSLLTTTENNGEYTDSSVRKRSKSASYQVCHSNSQVCSNEFNVKF